MRRVTSGNFLEQFDFFLFGFYASAISKAFFPAGSEFALLMLAFAVFGAGFLMQPLGTIVPGAYASPIGIRRQPAPLLETSTLLDGSQHARMRRGARILYYFWR